MGKAAGKEEEEEMEKKEEVDGMDDGSDDWDNELATTQTTSGSCVAKTGACCEQ